MCRERGGGGEEEEEGGGGRGRGGVRRRCDGSVLRHKSP